MPEKRERRAYNVRHCSDLPLALTVGSDADIEEARLCEELTIIQSSVKNILNLMQKLNTEDMYPNILVPLIILLTC
jgi:hypothetical protein